MVNTENKSADNKTLSSSALFPVKLHRLLQDASKKESYDSVISWTPGGKAFKVHDKERFAADIMPTYFGSSKYRSFQKNLNMWGFKAARKGECSHPLFVRDNEAQAHDMKRHAVKPPMKTKKSRPEQTVAQPMSRRVSADSGLDVMAAAAAAATARPTALAGSPFHPTPPLASLLENKAPPTLLGHVLPSAMYSSPTPLNIQNSKDTSTVAAIVNNPAPTLEQMAALRLLLADLAQPKQPQDTLSELRALTKMAIITELQKLDNALLTATTAASV